ncbi:MAG: hypothetical protein AAFR77_21210 [Cyanobacteria bacterium J06631_2]
MTDKTIFLKLDSKLLQKAEGIAGNGSNLHDFFVNAIENEVQRRQTSFKQVDFWQELEQLKIQMQQEGIEVNPQEVWGDIRDKEAGRDIVLP